MADPRFGSTSFHVAALYALAGDEKMDDFFRRLKANGVRIVDGNSVVRDLVARGDVKVGLTDTDDVNVALEDGQPIGDGPADKDGLGVPVMPNMVSMIANAPHSRRSASADRLPVVSRCGAAVGTVRGRTDPAACRGPRTQEHSGDRHVQTHDARLCESGGPSRGRHARLATILGL